MRYSISGIDPDFRTRSGFISRAGDVNLTLTNLFTIKGKPGGLVESFTPDLTLNGTWTYDRFVSGQGVRDPKLHINLNSTLKGGWGGRLFAAAGNLRLRPAHLPELRSGSTGPAGVGIDTIPFTGGNKRIPNRDYVFSFATPSWQGFSADAFALVGQDENFYEWASAEIIFSDFGLQWRPTDQLRIEARYRQNQYKRRGDRTLVGRQRIPRLKIEYQLARPLFIRVVGEYNSYESGQSPGQHPERRHRS